MDHSVTDHHDPIPTLLIALPCPQRTMINDHLAVIPDDFYDLPLTSQIESTVHHRIRTRGEYQRTNVGLSDRQCVRYRDLINI
jgi:hypothetical protein